MSSSKRRRVTELFVRACELGPSEREAFLDEACAGDPEARAGVESLIAWDEKAAEVFGEDGPGAALPISPEDLAAHPTSVGPYKIVEVLGEGGMGVVYLAEQEKPLRRRVALKLIKLGIETESVIRRFESERQALALMDHPSIARVYEAGVSETGRSYFAMEYVEGVPIGEYCERNRLSMRERLELFLEVCAGVQHAHQKGIIHRDLKPSNVLVATWDGRPAPKIIDFGIAKATAQRLTERTAFTELGQLVGTPEYMSPEQAELSGLDVDTRTDVYSLGMLLYVLLVGDLPFDSTELRGLSFDQIRKRILEDDPPSPSARLQTVDTSGAGRPGMDPAVLVRDLRGELDWIVMKSLEKDRGRRYQSASALAEDVERYLRNEPVLAGKPSRLYRWGKFVRRHAAAVGTAALLLFLLVAFSVAMTIQASRIARERDRANEEAATASEVSGFLVRLFELSDPGEARGNSVTAREILDRGARKIETELAEQPRVQARLLETIGIVYRSLGLFGRSQELLERALQVREARLGPQDPSVAGTLLQLGWVLWIRGEPDRATEVVERGVAIRRQYVEADHLDMAFAYTGLGALRHAKGRFGEAEELARRALAIWERHPEVQDPNAAHAMDLLADIRQRDGHTDEAIALLERAYRHREATLSADHFWLAQSVQQLTALYVDMGDMDRAEELARHGLELREKSLGPDHEAVARSLHNLALVLSETGDLEGALAHYRRALEIKERVLGTDHAGFATTLSNLSELLWQMGDDDGARAGYERVIEIREGAYGRNHPRVARSLIHLAELHAEHGRPADARPLFERVLAIREEATGPDSPEVADVLEKLAPVVVSLGQEKRAEAMKVRAAEIRAGISP